MKYKWIALCLVSALGMLSTAANADEIKIGYVNTFSGSGANLGKHYRDAFELALKELGGKMAGLDVKVEYGDDQLKPEIAKSVVERMVERDKVDIVAGFNFSNVLLASLKTVTGANKLLISSNAGPSNLAGEQCDPNFFDVGQQNDGASEVLGRYLKKQNVASVYAIAPNYQAGRDMIAGLKRGFGKQLADEVYTQLSQTDFQAELSQIQAANPAAVFAFMPGGNGINFVKQWAQAGLIGKIPLYSVYSVDHTTLSAIGPSAEGTLGVSQYVEDLPFEANQEFVKKFVDHYHYYPSEYAASAYDTAMLINSAVVATHGKLDDIDALRAAVQKADFKSVRGPNFKLGHNHMPIQNYYLRETVKREDGKFGFVTRDTVAENYKDHYGAQCTNIK
ncbi:ABC transporter substrate-binding protein [Eoetvoesiella caeni]|uniref:Branched-chain amino acid transport system substrate-binding protein n=1 Tax=Eoetvoesiella caeni TaxID=645616 RepID=A0A366H8D2_9BURK|nr:ABC transporter substrate-binding protein [Eoetvoesiella caeni]MCI2809690.1 ABC transporter substrate-binding protein [Eoetvoesiella caeni]NYT56393.1 ABC transporter substrate-binding protein [Eoetvoesiella caeni]RBP38451.1 branched-chain amino acid transport system substrate-binding protein [Eoetvoesiella caeni]